MNDYWRRTYEPKPEPKKKAKCECGTWAVYGKDCKAWMHQDYCPIHIPVEMCDFVKIFEESLK